MQLRSTLLLIALSLLFACNPTPPAPVEPPTPAEPTASPNADAGADSGNPGFGEVVVNVPNAGPLKDGEPAPGAPAAKPPAPPAPTFEKLDAAAIEAIATAKQNHATWLNAGREAVKARKYGEGIKLLRQALSVRPDDVATLGELGWALYLAGDRAQARRVTLQGLALEPEPQKQAAMLYNLGRIAEDEKNPAEAVQHYQRSLALRDNAEVKKRLGALAATPVVPATLEDLCAAAMDTWSCTDDGAKAEADDLLGTCACKITRRLTNQDGFALEEAALLEVSGQAGAGGSIDGSVFLAVKTRTGGWQLVTMLTNNYSPGVSYIHHSGTLQHMAFEPLTSLINALVVYYENREDDGDYSENTNEWATERTFLACYALDGVQCISICNGRGSGKDRMLDDGPAPPGAYTRQWGMSTSVDGKGSLFSISVQGEDHPPEGDLALLMGVHAIQSAPTLSGVTLIPLR